VVFVLVHSPLVGPGTWTLVAQELERRGVQAVVPSLLPAADAPPPQWQQCVEIVRAATRMVPSPIVLVGHSGGGLLLPAMASAVAPDVARFIFVDSGLPATTGETPFVPAQFLEQLRSLAVDGKLPPWSSWWGEDAMNELVPDEVARAAIVRELPSLPLSYFEQIVPSPADWERVPSGYLLFSEAYKEAAAEARARGWRVQEISGAQHLHTVVAPVAVTDALLRLAAD
jgi:pimeloyl-ACP methyl ester carboxylesterase